jgi:ABC-type sugar transport system ATPase subunit
MDQYVHQLPMARAIVFEPKLLLFDEPLSNLDLKLRRQMCVKIKRVEQEIGITSVYVTHDQAEALVLSDAIIVMSKGTIEQLRPGQTVYLSFRPDHGWCVTS